MPLAIAAARHSRLTQATMAHLSPQAAMADTLGTGMHCSQPMAAAAAAAACINDVMDGSDVRGGIQPS